MNKYTIEFDGNGATSGSMKPLAMTYGKVTALPANTFKCTGYTFAGWYTNSTFTKAIEEISEGSTGNKTLYAKWTANKYTIVFNHNAPDEEITGTMKDKTMTYNKAAALTANAFKRAGWTFAGWNTEEDGSGEAFINKASVQNLTAEDGAEVILYAQWSPIFYTITYKLNGGVNSEANPDSYTVEDGITLAEPTREGYTFAGWYTNSTFTKAIEEISEGSTGNKTLYAKWTANKYTIVFDYNAPDEEITGTMQDKAMTYNKAAHLTANAFKRAGWTFAGWNTEEDGSGTAIKNKASVKNLATEDGAYVTLYAQWKIVNYKITYKLNYGTNSLENPATYNVESGTIVLKDPERPGYTFQGWFTDSKYKNQITEIAARSTGAKTLYAKWTANKYTIVFDQNAPDEEITGTMKDKAMTYGKAATLTANAFKRAGYTFNGWDYTAADGTTKHLKNKASVKNLTAEDGAYVTLYAQWKAK